jgi:phage gp45-like
MIRGIIDSVVEGAIKRLATKGLSGENFAGREYFQHYGFTSRPVAGAECILVREGNKIVAIASDDRRYRIAIESGEVAIYDNQGQAVHMRDGNRLQVTCTGVLTIDAANQVVINTQVAQVNAGQSATVTSPLVTVDADTKVTLNTPLVEISGNLTVGGTGVVTGALSSKQSVSDPTGTMQSMRGIFNNHTHQENGDGGGVTDPPSQQM